jgi:3-methyl-2-oxobutanoate hydroxymethyltransferase
MKTSKVTIHTLRQMKERGEKIAMLTAYDATFARLLDESGADVLLVGDSLGMVVQGHDTTLPVTLEEIGYHCRAVVRGARRARRRRHAVHVVSGVVRAGRHERGKLMKEGCHSVKLEAAPFMRKLVQRLSRQASVMGHIGLTRRAITLGGFKVGRDVGGRERLLSMRGRSKKPASTRSSSRRSPPISRARSRSA